MKVTKQAKQTSAIIAGMVAAATGAQAAELQTPEKAQQDETTVPAEKPAAKKSVVIKPKAVSKTQAKKAAKPTKAVKKAAKVGAKAAVKKAQESSKNPDVVKSAKQGLTYGQWAKLLQNTAVHRDIKVPAAQAAFDKKFQPLYMKGAKIGEALGA